MLRSDLCDFSDAYIVVQRRVTASFNHRRVNYVNNDALFPDKTFPDGSSDEQKTAARNTARINSVNTADASGDRRTIINLSTVF